MYEYIKNYDKIGDKIREYRKNKGISQTDFISMLKDKGCGIGRNTLSDFENGLQNKITLPQLLAMCDCLGVSLGHLLGEYSAKTYDKQFIIDNLRISEKSIDNLATVKNDYIGALSVLLESNRLQSLLKSIAEYKTACNELISLQNELKTEYDNSLIGYTDNEVISIDNAGGLHRKKIKPQPIHNYTDTFQQLETKYNQTETNTKFLRWNISDLFNNIIGSDTL